MSWSPLPSSCGSAPNMLRVTSSSPTFLDSPLLQSSSGQALRGRRRRLRLRFEKQDPSSGTLGVEGCHRYSLKPLMPEAREDETRPHHLGCRISRSAAALEVQGLKNARKGGLALSKGPCRSGNRLKRTEHTRSTHGTQQLRQLRVESSSPTCNLLQELTAWHLRPRLAKDKSLQAFENTVRRKKRG